MKSYIESMIRGFRGVLRNFIHSNGLYYNRSHSQLIYAVRTIMAEVSKTPIVKACCHAANRLEELHELSDGLERCQKSLNDYLNTKRNAFPRFFFISDDELLSILGSSEPECVQEHMIKMFDNIASLQLVKAINQEMSATAMVSSEGEIMQFRQSVLATGRVEEWMTRVEAEMKSTNRLITKEAIYYYSSKGSRWVWLEKLSLGQVRCYRT
ncbi:unnamed protein product [Protopolystoma xenopodis]|uniref:Dynein heavy chain linker domain-containing protein n=1 Tax=Protopolystoma xenopodis TaxID=117903 RepID=A0A448WED9_9PLAT|nr:unnamed protein product [Protopolystoma xenopodis]